MHEISNNVVCATSKFSDQPAHMHSLIRALASQRVGISGTTAKMRQRKFVPSSQLGPFPVVAMSRKSQTKAGTLACFDLL